MRWRAQRTQKQAANVVDVSLRTYQNAEYGEFIQWPTAAKIAKKVGIDLDKLLSM